jgi:proteasome lid subunit RPN8/RPN11
MPNTELVVTQDQVKDLVADALVEMVDHTASRPDEEVVGAITFDGTVHHLRNEAEDKTCELVVGPSQFEDLDVVVVYHSHPDGLELISVKDEAGLAPIPAVIVTHQAITLWWYSDRIPGYYRIWDRYYGIE